MLSFGHKTSVHTRYMDVRNNDLYTGDSFKPRRRTQFFVISCHTSISSVETSSETSYNSYEVIIIR